MIFSKFIFFLKKTRQNSSSGYARPIKIHPKKILFIKASHYCIYMSQKYDKINLKALKHE